MAAQKSIVKQAVAPSRAAKAKAPSSRARARKPPSSRKRASTSVERVFQQANRPSAHSDDELLSILSSRLDLLQTVSLALRTLEERPDVGPICSALEHAVELLGEAHETVGLRLQRMST